MTMKRTTCLVPLSVLTAFTALTSCDKEPAVQPNFVIIQLDDLGYSDLGVHGNELVETPNIDRFARASRQFANFCVNPVCAPTRASLLTGRHFPRTGVSHVHGGKDFLNLDEMTMANLLKDEGYRTGIWGKWHSGHTPGYYPWERGFDEAYMARLYQHRNSDGLMNGKPVQYDVWADQVIVDQAIEFIEGARDQPFLAYLSFLTCHSPLDAPDSLVQKYLQKGLSANLSTLYAMVDHCDYHLGRFFNYLDTSPLAENTYVFFMSDNGPAVLNDVLTDADREIRYVNDLRGHKGNIWENGVKSPLFVYRKGHTVPGKINELCDICDIAPTLLELAGFDPGASGVEFDGSSFASLIRGKVRKKNKLSFNYANPGWPPTDKPWTPDGVKDEYRPVRPADKLEMKAENQIISVRDRRFKLLLNPGPSEGMPDPVNQFVFIDLEKDPGENKNQLYEFPDEFLEMKDSLYSWWSSIIREDGSFRMPVFLIGKDGMTHSPVLGKAPRETSEGLKSTFDRLKGWDRQGAYAVYEIHVHESGKYAVTAFFDQCPDIRKDLLLTLGKDSLFALWEDTTRFEPVRLEEAPASVKLEIPGALIPAPGQEGILNRLEFSKLEGNN